jgi:hypothetical protein
MLRRGGFVGGRLDGKEVHGKHDGNNEKKQATEGGKNDGVTAGLGSFRRIYGLLLGKEAGLR